MHEFKVGDLVKFKRPGSHFPSDTYIIFYVKPSVANVGWDVLLFCSNWLTQVHGVYKANHREIGKVNETN